MAADTPSLALCRLFIPPDRSTLIASYEKYRGFCAYQILRTHDIMLKPLLLLCWTAIFVSAGDQKINNDTSVPPVSLLQEGPSTLSPVDDAKPASEHVPSVQNVPAADHPKSNTNLNSKVPGSLDVSDGETSVTDSATIKPVPTTKSTTTTEATTTTKATTTTTPSSTTTSTTTTPSTTAVPTSTVPAPTTPVPPPSTQRWELKTNITCIIVDMAAQFNFSFTANNKTTIQKTMDIPSKGKNGTVSGVCGNTEQNLTVSWDAPNGTDNFTLHFVRNETTKYYSLHHFEIFLAPEEFPADKWDKNVTLKHMVPQYEIGMRNSYRCLKEQKLNLYMDGVNGTVGYLTVSNFQFQAFRNDNKTIFGIAKDCAFETPDIVPITVGCALAGLVVIVLIAYLVGRRRSQARGYLSM